MTIWDADTAKQIAFVESDWGYGTIAANAQSIFVTNQFGLLANYSADTGKRIAFFVSRNMGLAAENMEQNRSQHFVFDSPGGKWVVSMGASLFDVAAKKEVKFWRSAPLPTRFGFTPDDKTLVTTDRNGTMTIWDLPAVKERRVILKGWTGTASAFSSDNRTAALRMDDGAISLFDLTTGVELARLGRYNAPPGPMAFSPDGKSFVTGGDDGTLRFWCPVTGAQRLNLRAHGGPITSLAFTSDGASLATAGDRTVHLWSGR